ncbi:MAG: hypothetical protein KDA21_01270 [Phycisphaerales bacterium]|nr:hypothetical protein [Phycisphaerales bacterium]
MTDPAAGGTGAGLQGTYRVRLFRPALDDARRLVPRKKDLMVLRSHALKLRFWPRHPSPDAPLLDMDWDWIRALKGHDIGELRIADRIGGNDNLRVVFYKGDPQVRRPLPIIWIVAVVQKKRMDWTAHQLSVFRSRRTLIDERYYVNREFI